MRPTYESKGDQWNESEAKLKLEKVFAVELKKLPVSYHADWAAIKNKRLVGFVEYKRRNISFSTYPTIMLSFLKLTMLNSLTTAYGGLYGALKSKFIVELNDGFYSCDLGPNMEGAHVEFGGRTVNTRDSADIEPVIHIPRTHFKKLEIK